MKIGCGGITWNTYAQRHGVAFTQDRILAEIAEAGYEGAPFGIGETREPDQVRAQYARHGLDPAPGYLGAGFWKQEEEEQIYERAREAARLSRALGCTELYVAASPLTRREASGHVRPQDDMPDAAYDQFARTLNHVGAICLEHGVRIALHNHVGSVIETRGEIDRLFARVDRQLAFQGPDIGHLAWAGADVVQFCRDYADSIISLHVKDIDPQVCVRGIAEGWGYSAFSDHGIFVELGEGMVDLQACFGVLREANYDGWVIVETDVTQMATPLESAVTSRRYLERLGL